MLLKMDRPKEHTVRTAKDSEPSEEQAILGHALRVQGQQGEDPSSIRSSSL